MGFFIGASILFFFGLKILISESGITETLFGIRREMATLSEIVALFHELQETLESGMIPAPDRWAKLRSMRAPWGPLAHDSLESLRNQGSSVLPTLKRLRSFAEEHRNALLDAKAKASQAMAQAMVCVALVPLFGTLLAYLMPGLEGHTGSWVIACAVALLSAGGGAVWLMHIAETARWGGLPNDLRPWVLIAQCGAERFLAMVRAGNPADVAWAQSNELLANDAPELARLWGHSVWDSSAAAPTQLRRNATLTCLVEAGSGFRKAIQVSLMEGRPCTERIEAGIQALRANLKSQIERELAVLPTRALKPLFVCVAPSLLGLLGYGMYLGFSQSFGS